MAPVHPLEDPVRPRLHRQMQVGHQLRAVPMRRDQVVVHVVRMRCRETDAFQPVDVVQRPDQPRQRPFRAVGALAVLEELEQGLEFVEAVETLARLVGVEVPREGCPAPDLEGPADRLRRFVDWALERVPATAVEDRRDSMQASLFAARSYLRTRPLDEPVRRAGFLELFASGTGVVQKLWGDSSVGKEVQRAFAELAPEAVEEPLRRLEDLRVVVRRAEAHEQPGRRSCSDLEDRNRERRDHARVPLQPAAPLTEADGHRLFAALQIALDAHLADRLTQLFLLRLGQIANLRVRGHAGGLADFVGSGPTDAVNVSQRYPGVLLDGQVDACYTCHLLAP